jgi:hypothetical protein
MMGAVSSDLVTFVRARLDEDETVARAVGDPERVWREDSAWAADLLNPLPSQRRDHPGYVPMITAEDLAHIARHDPARVLRDVEAKRRLLFQFEHRGNAVRGAIQPSTGGVWDDLLRMLALPYAGHPDYRAEWSS